MNKFVKGCLILVIILAAAGVALLGTAAFRGFRWAVLREASQEGKFHIGPVYLYMDDPFGLSISWGRPGENGQDAGRGNQRTYTFDGKQIREMQIDSGSGDVRICPRDDGGSQVEVSATERNYTHYEVNQSGETLKITGKGSWNGISIGRHQSSEVTIYVPENMDLDNLELYVGAGDLEVEAPLTTDGLYVDTGVGDMEVSEELTVDGDARIDVGTGNITIYDLNCSGSLDSSCGVGNLELLGTVRGDIAAKCGTGDMKINLKGDSSKYNYELSCGVGSLYVNGTEYSSLKKNLVIRNGDQYPDIFLDTGVGDLDFTLD